MSEKADKLYAQSANNNEAVSINDEDNENDSESVQEQESKSSGGSKPTINTNFTTQTEVNQQLAKLTPVLDNITKLLGLEPPKKAPDENSEGNEGEQKNAPRQRVTPTDKQKQDNKENKSENNSTDKKADDTKKDSEKSSSSGGLNLSNLNSAAQKFSDDPVIALKEKAKELGKQMGLKAGNEEAQGKISSQENEAKFDAFLAQSGTPNPLPESAQKANNENAASAISDTNTEAAAATPAAAAPIAAPAGETAAPTAAPAAPATTAAPASTSTTAPATADGKKEEKKDEGPALTAEQAAEHITQEFKIGYNQGFNIGYTEGANVMIAANSPEARAKALKETQAYKDGILAGQAEATAPGAETAARIQAFEAQYCKPFHEAKAKGVTGEELKKLEDNNIAYNQGFNNGYTKGGNEVFNAEAKKKEAEKESPEYKEGAKLAEEVLADPSKEASNEALVDKGSALLKRGYYQTFNKGYTQKANETIMKERNAFTDEGLKAGPYKAFYEAGIELGKEGNLCPSDDKINAKFNPLYNAFEKEKTSGDNKDNVDLKKEKSNATAALNIGIQKGYQEQQKAQKDAEKDKAKQSPLFQKAYAIGQVIGLLEFKGGDAFLKNFSEQLTAFFKKEKFNIGNNAASLQTIKDYLIAKTIGATVTKPTIVKSGKEMPNPDYQDYNVGFNQGWDMGYKNDFIKDPKAEEKTGVTANHIDQSPEYQQGFKDGTEVGKLSAETSKKIASPADKQAFDAEVQKLTEQAKAKGADFYRGFNNGMTYGFMAESAGVETEKDPLDSKDAKSDEVLKKYKDIGDTDMVGRLEKLYKDTYKEIHEEIYSSLTKPLQAAGQEEKSNANALDQFDTIPTEADLERTELQVFGKKLGAQGEFSDLYDDELIEIETMLSKAADAKEKAKLEQTKKAIADEIHDYCKIYKSAYQAASNDAKDKAYSYIKGYTEMMQQQNGPTPSITIPKINKYSKSEYNKGKTVAESYGSAIRMNKMFDEHPNGKYVSDEARPKMPKQVVSKAYKEGFEEAFIKWSIVEYTILGIPFTAQIKESEIFKEYGTNENEGGISTQDTSGTNVTKPERLTYGTAPRYNVPKDATQAKKLKTEIAGIIANDESYYKAKMMAEYYTDLVAYTNTYLTDLKDTQELRTSKISSQVSAIETLKTNVDKKDSAQLPTIKEELSKILEPLQKQVSNAEKITPFLSKFNACTDGAQFKTIFDDFLKTLKTITAEKKASDKAEKKAQKIEDQAIEAKEIDLSKETPEKIQAAIDEVEKKTFKNKSSKLAGKANPFADTKNNIDKTVPEFSAGYKDAIKKVESNNGLAGETVKELDKRIEEVGYVKGYVQKIGALGLKNKEEDKALNILKAYAKRNLVKVPQLGKIAALEKYTSLNDLEITPDAQMVEALKSSKELEAKNKEITLKGVQRGEAAAEISYNLSTKDFAYVDNIEYKKEDNISLAVGPLGQLATSFFEKLLSYVDKIKVFIDLQKQVSTIMNTITSSNIANLKTNSTYTAFTKDLYGKGITVAAPTIKGNEATLPQGKTTYKDTASNSANTINMKDATSMLFNVSDKGFLVNGKSTSGIVGIYEGTDKQLGLTGSGLFLSNSDKKHRLDNPKFVIPSLQNSLIAPDATGKKVAPKNKALLDKELTLSTGKIMLTSGEIKNTLLALQEKYITILNEEESEGKAAENKAENNNSDNSEA